MALLVDIPRSIFGLSANALSRLSKVFLDVISQWVHTDFLPESAQMLNASITDFCNYT